jgi:hypothetical protein
MPVSHLKYLVAPVTAIALLTSCAGGSSTPTTPNALQQNQSHARPNASCPCLYVANNTGTVSVYAAGASGTAPPIQKISGSKTGLNQPYGIAVDASGNMYVANYAGGSGSGSVTVYAAGATGNVKPTTTITGSNTGLVTPVGVALDPVNGDIYVANDYGGASGSGSVTSYAPGSNGNVSPTSTITGTNTGLLTPFGLALDASGNIYVPNPEAASITIYAAGATGNVAPMKTITGASTGLNLPYQVALDSSTNIYVANTNGNSLTVYAAGANGNVAPIRTIEGSATKLGMPEGIALDGSFSNNIYASNHSGLSVTAYAAGTKSNVRPILTIKGKKALSGPEGIVIR